jgi:hypothetical protein
LSALLEAAGHSDFRDARGPLGLNQRQAGGKFTRDEADELIARLESEAEMAEATAGTDDTATPPAPRRAASPAADRRDAERDKALAKFTDEVLAAELQRRGWVVMEP